MRLSFLVQFETDDDDDDDDFSNCDWHVLMIGPSI